MGIVRGGVERSSVFCHSAGIIFNTRKVVVICVWGGGESRVVTM